MSNQLKRSLIEKMAVNPSKDFDTRFFEKLRNDQKRPRLFAHWFTWAISGCATTSVLFLAINSYRVPTTTFNHREYVETALEIQTAINEVITSEEMSDLTSASVDEI